MSIYQYPKVEIFVGPPASGKSRRANEICAGQVVAHYNCFGTMTKKRFNTLCRFDWVKGNENVLLIDDLPVEYLERLMTAFFSDRLRIEPRNGQDFYQLRKRVIIGVSGADDYELPVDAFYHRRFTVVKFPEAAPEHWAHDPCVASTMSFNGDMTYAINQGHKTVTRRKFSSNLILNDEPDRFKFHVYSEDRGGACFEDLKPEGTPWITPIRCDYGKIGDLVLVNNTDLMYPNSDQSTLIRITNIRVERLQDITPEDAVAEGIKVLESWPEVPDRPIYLMYGFEEHPMNATFDPVNSFFTLWISIYGSNAVLKNPFVWVIEFEKVEKPIP